ncbi:MAG: hypothetical protein LBL49_10205 [Clostridiales Family XIII bacterium]|jgi:regulatory protein YycH of two-component signal transduction system YycFG|nr:hypothetical protein [Clostridiales Family XIII bacterium]
MGISKTLIEKIKNVLIVVLILSTILLLHFLWNDNPVGDFSIPVLGGERVEPILIKTVMNPDKITVSFGGENYTVIAPSAGDWDSSAAGQGATRGIIQRLQEFSLSGMIMPSGISKSDFNDVIRARSIRADFPFAIPFSEFCTEYNLRGLARIDLIESFTGVAYSEASPNSVFFFNMQEDKYYRLAANEADTDFDALITDIERRDKASFYPLRMYSGVENEVMIPLDMQIAMAQIPYSNNADAVSSDEDDETTGMAKKLFGSSFDFTRKIIEGNGTMVYMYGYGEMVLVVNRDGSFEYSASGRDSNGTVSFFEALNIALDFISRHGALEAHGQTPERMYLKSVEFNPDRKGYRFAFGFKIDDYAVHYLNDEALIVETSGSQAIYFKWDLIEYQAAGAYTAGAGDEAEREALRPFDLLAENFVSLFGVLREHIIVNESENPDEEENFNSLVSTEVMFETVVQGVSDVSAGYLRRETGNANEIIGLSRGAVNIHEEDSTGQIEKLLPVWIFTIMGVDFYFDLYEGDLVGYTP